MPSTASAGAAARRVPVTSRGTPLAAGAPRDSAEAVSWRLHREIVLLAGWGRAILMQLAHPLVAQGVLDHSAVLREPGAHVRRLRRTLGAMLDLTFGSEADADA